MVVGGSVVGECLAIGSVATVGSDAHAEFFAGDSFIEEPLNALDGATYTGMVEDRDVLRLVGGLIEGVWVVVGHHVDLIDVGITCESRVRLEIWVCLRQRRDDREVDFVGGVKSLDRCLDFLAEKCHVGGDAGLIDRLVIEVDTDSSSNLHKGGDLVGCGLS